MQDDLFGDPAEPVGHPAAVACPPTAAPLPAGPAEEPSGRVQRSISEPLRIQSDFDTRWNGPDRGLITAWEAGRQKAKDDPDSAARARAGELVVLPFKGGVDKATRAQKIGTHLYLAMLQGLRGEDLDVDLAGETVRTCTATGTSVLYTSAYEKYANAL